METIKEFLEFELISLDHYKIRVYTLVTILIIFLITKLILRLIKKTLFRKRKINDFDKGNAYALFKIFRYVIWVIAIGLVLETMLCGISMRSLRPLGTRLLFVCLYMFLIVFTIC